MLFVAVPVAEVAFAVVRRARARAPLFTGDRSHIYDKMVERGLSTGTTSLICAGLQAAGAGQRDGVKIFHAGTRAEGGRILVDGGRVLGVTALGNDAAEAQTKAYAAVDRIKWADGFCRRDIGFRAVERERKL